MAHFILVTVEHKTEDCSSWYGLEVSGRKRMQRPVSYLFIDLSCCLGDGEQRFTELKQKCIFEINCFANVSRLPLNVHLFHPAIKGRPRHWDTNGILHFVLTLVYEMITKNEKRYKDGCPYENVSCQIRLISGKHAVIFVPRHSFIIIYHAILVFVFSMFILVCIKARLVLMPG